MKCTSCGVEMGDAKFCPDCGAKRVISPANIFATDHPDSEAASAAAASAASAAPVAPAVYDAPEEEKKPGFFRRNRVAIIAIITVLIIAAVIIVIAVLKEKDKDDKKTQPSPERWEQLREEREALHEAERQEKEEEASQYDLDWDLDYDFSDIDDMDAFINAITGGQIQGMSQYMSPDMQDALEEYLEVFQMLDDLDMSNLDQYVDQINQISYDLSGIDISGIYSGDPDAAYEEIMQQMEELFGDDVDLDWDFDEDLDVSWDVEDDEVVITYDDEGEAEN